VDYYVLIEGVNIKPTLEEADAAYIIEPEGSEDEYLLNYFATAGMGFVNIGEEHRLFNGKPHEIAKKFIELLKNTQKVV